MEYQPEKESWQSYAERLDHFFIATNVVEDDQKVTALIVANDPSFYTLVKELSFPINPKTMTFNDVMSVLERHYVGVKNIFRERKLFYNAVLEPNESASEWFRRIKSLAIDCEFGLALEEVLVDKFVCGFEGNVLQRFYEQDESLDLMKALEIAQLHDKNFDDNESIEEEESDFSLLEDHDYQVSDSEVQDFNHQESTLESQKKYTKQEKDSIQGSVQSQELLMLEQQICLQRHLLSDIIFKQSQQQRRIRQHKGSQSHHQISSAPRQKPQEKQVNKHQLQNKKIGNNQMQDSTKSSQPHKLKKHVQKQTNESNQPQFQKLGNHQKLETLHQKHPKPVQKQNTQKNQPNQQQVKSQHQQSNQNHKPNISQKPTTLMSHLQVKQHQQKSPSAQKPMNHQQKTKPQTSQNTIQKSTTIIKKTTIKTETLVANTKKGPSKCHKCGKTGHNANACYSK